MKRFVIVLGAALFLTVTSAAIAQSESVEDKKSTAVIAALNWLALLDEGAYEASWEDAAAYFKNAVNKSQWESAIAAIFEPLGAVLSRELDTATYSATLPGAPDGEYVVIQFKTSFENKTSAIETVTPMLDPDGSWRVSGYFIK